MNEHKTSIPVKKVFKAVFITFNLTMILILIETRIEIRDLQKKSALLEEGTQLLLKNKKLEIDEKISDLKKMRGFREWKSENSI